MHTKILGDDVDIVFDKLANQGYCIIDDFLDPVETKHLASVADQLWNIGSMSQAGIGKAATHHHTVRGDSIYWLDESDPNVAVQCYFEKMHSLRQLLNQHLFMGIYTLEAHLAYYPVGSHYKKHLDQFKSKISGHEQTRLLSAVLYLNEEWEIGNGGELRLYLDDAEKYLDITPIGGRLVLFLSGEFWHEVLPATRDRRSLTAWFRSRE
jgi:SM-20-related protein